MRKGYATQGAVQPGQVFMEDAKGNRYDTSGNVIPPSEEAINNALTTARAETYDPYAEEIASAKKLMADQAYQDQSWSDWAGDVGQNLYNTGKAFLPTALGGQGAVGLSDIAKGAYESAKSGATLPGDVLMGKTNVFDPTSGELTDEVLRRGADFTGLATMGPSVIPYEANTLRMGAKGIPAPEPTQMPSAEDAALRAAQEAAGEDQVATAARLAREQGVDDSMEVLQPPSVPPVVSPDAPTKAFVQFGKPIPPTTPPPDPQLVTAAQADTRMGADIVKRRLPVIVPEQERVVGGVYTPGAPDGRRWSELTPAELSARGPGAKFTNDDLQNIWNQTLAEVSEAGRQAVANTGATWSVFPAEQWDKALKLPLRSQLWYELSGEAFVDRLPDLKYNEHMMFLDLVGATSARARPGENLERALGVLSQRLRGVPVDVDVTIPSTVSAALRRDGRNVSSDLANKTGMFSDTLALTGGLPVRYPISVNDVWVGKAFGITDDQLSSNQALHEVFGKYTNKLRDLVNNTSPGQYPHQSWNLQARQWVELRAADEGIDTSLPVSVDGSDYAGEWDKIASKLERAGIQLPEGKITRDVLLDPRFADALRPTTPGFRSAPKATVEFGTLLTPNGQKAAQIYERARQMGDQNTQDEYLAALTTAMYRTARGKPTLWEDTARAALGDTTSVTRIYSPTTDDPFAISGTFAGAAAPNIRVPLRSLTPDQIAYFNAMAGKGLRQKAMAAVEINRLEPGQVLPEGAVYSHAVRFDFDGPIPQTMLTDFASALGDGFEISAMRYPDGVVFDINPRFGDAGPEAADPATIASAIDMLGEKYGAQNAKAFDISYKSEYGKNYVEDPGDGTGYRQIINDTLKAWEADAVAQLQFITEGKFSDAVLKKYLKGDDAALKAAAAKSRTPVSGYTGRAKTVRKVFQQRLSDHASLAAKWEAVGKEVDDKLGALIPKWERRQAAAGKRAEKENAPLPPEQRQANFQSTFGQTYLKDPQGNPMRLYHLTPQDITEFSASPKNRAGPVVFFSPYKDYQPAYHQAGVLGPRGEFTQEFREGANVMPVYADVRSPLVLDHPRKIREAAAKYQNGDREFPRYVSPEAKAAMEADGYDAIIFGGDNPIPYGDRPMDARLGHQEAHDEEIIIFDPKKIKSAISNRGTYDLTKGDITKAYGGALVDDDDIDNALRLARAMGGRAGYAEAGSVPVMMEDAKGNKYDAQGNVIPPTSPGPNPRRSDVTPEALAAKAVNDPATYDALMERYAVPDRDIAEYEALKQTVSKQPQAIQQMTHVGDRPRREMTVDMPLFGGEYSMGTAPYDVAEGLQGMAQTAYDFKTAPAYFFPPTAPLALGADILESRLADDPLGFALNAALTPQGASAAKSALGAVRRNPKATAAAIGASAYLSPDEAEAGPARWFSKAMEVARAIPMEKMTGQQALAMLRKGVSPEELKWTGADAFLPQQKQITKQDLVDYLAKNRVQTQDVVFGGAKPVRRGDVVPSETAIAPYRERWDELVAQNRAINEVMLLPPSERDADIDDLLAQRNDIQYEMDQIHDKAVDATIEEMGGLGQPVRYGPGSTYGEKYMTRGGEDYRETLITLPRKEFGNLYQSGHWEGIPNVVGHIRTQVLDVTPPGSNRPYKAFNVDEAQSDYAKAGRDKGFVTPEDKANYPLMSKQYDQLNAERRRLETDVRYGDDSIPEIQAATAKLAEVSRQMEALANKMTAIRSGGIPVAPYVTGTQGWTDLSIKKALDQAMDAGADYFTFTPGEAQAARYDLSKHISKLQYNPDDGSLLAYDPKGKMVINESVNDPDDLDEYLGKELADKMRLEAESRRSVIDEYEIAKDEETGEWGVYLHGEPASETFPSKGHARDYLNELVANDLANNPAELSGLDLKVGGEGMIDYYNNIYKKRVEKVVKDATGKKVQWEVIPVQTADGPREQLGFRLTDDMKEARFSDFNKGGRVSDPVVNKALSLTRY